MVPYRSNAYAAAFSVGINDYKLPRCLQLDKKLTLEKANTMVRQAEQCASLLTVHLLSQ